MDLCCSSCKLLPLIVRHSPPHAALTPLPFSLPLSPPQVFQREQKILIFVISILQILLINKCLPQHSLSDCNYYFAGFDLRRLCKLINRYLQARAL